MTVYQKADQDLLQAVQETMEQYHGELADTGVTVKVLLAYGPTDKNGDLTGPALHSHGSPALAKIKITSLRDRAAGMADALMELDGDQIEEWSYEQLIAIIDHELEHLQLVVDSENTVKRDDLDRPRLTIRRHDWQFCWFDVIARRHGENAPEVIQAKKLVEESGELYQLYLPGLEPA